MAVQNNQGNVVRFIRAIGPYVKLCMDFDDTLGDTEKVVAKVTADLVNPFLCAAGFPSLTVKDVCTHYSGLSFSKQLEKLSASYGLTFPQDLAKQKRAGNLAALAMDARPIPGSEQVLAFIRGFGFKAIVLTAADPERTNTSLKSTGHNKYLTTAPEREPDKIPIVSIENPSGQPRLWQGKPIPKLLPKPDPGGSKFVAGLLGGDPSQVMGWEDSAPGIIANDLAGFGALAIISLSRRCRDIPDHAESLVKIISPQKGRQVVIVDQSWAPAINAALTLGLKNAHEANVQSLPTQLPDEVIQWIDNEFCPVNTLFSSSQG